MKKCCFVIVSGRKNSTVSGGDKKNDTASLSMGQKKKKRYKGGKLIVGTGLTKSAVDGENRQCRRGQLMIGEGTTEGPGTTGSTESAVAFGDRQYQANN